MDKEAFVEIADQLMSGNEVVVEGRSFPVRRTGRQRFRTVRFMMSGREYQGIQQNPEKPSRWGLLARQGHRVVQFRDLLTQKYIGATVDRKFQPYGR
ncbi:MAG TPA: hypothetical protein VI386_24745 [Candidatus Sulfotelmatobacter sp.]